MKLSSYGFGAFQQSCYLLSIEIGILCRKNDDPGGCPCMSCEILAVWIYELL